MDIIRITMSGYGCEINRGIVPNGKERKIEESLDNVWLKDIFKRLEEETKITKIISEKGLINGDICIEVNDEIIIEMSISSFEALVKSKHRVIGYPKTKDTIVTSVQHQEGIISDTIFLLDGEFDFNKLSIVKKDIKDNIDKNIVSSLYCEIYYEGQLIPMTDNLTDLRMSRLYLEKTKENGQKKNRKF